MTRPWVLVLRKWAHEIVRVYVVLLLSFSDAFGGPACLMPFPRRSTVFQPQDS